MASFMSRSGAWTDPTFRTRNITACHKTLASMALMFLQNQQILLRTSLINNSYRSIWFDQNLRKAFKPSTLLQTDHSIPLATKSRIMPWTLAAICFIREYSRLSVTSRILENPPTGIRQLREEVDYVIEIWADPSWGLDLTISKRAPDLGDCFLTLRDMFFTSWNVDEIHRILKDRSSAYLRALRQQWSASLTIVFCELALSSLEMKSFPPELTLICQTIYLSLEVDPGHLLIPPGDRGNIIHSVFLAVRREIANKRVDSITDEVISYLLLLLRLLSRAKLSYSKVGECRKVIREYIVARDTVDWSALTLVRGRDESYHLEDCVLRDLKVGGIWKLPADDLCISAAWHLCQNMSRDIAQDNPTSSASRNRLYDFVDRLFVA
ncbi:hypothetical protein K435DRAFT_869287 [Dendrothele bispora CBS 962.96]|uniref:Uncharacterized protein n=1 Tax=Dendrothele bispora (strain CBS 962.96) TaxID=1314807 RepID=A0A4S8LA26_DENBC|nr:hypothetical protein K435DRAFT_869287 [Dendrothele bispora CBS 962.96]